MARVHAQYNIAVYHPLYIRVVIVIVAEKYEDTKQISPWCIALGSFDGVHLGHQKLIKLVIDEAKLYGAGSMVYTFRTHPRKILSGNKPIYLITDNKKKSEILESMGIDMLFLEDFGKVRNMSAEDFVKSILVNEFNVKCVVVGYNYRFGCQGEGNADKIKEYGDKYGFKVDVVQAVEVKGHNVSSSYIRHIIRSGDMERASEYLGRHYSINGRVIYGKQNGNIMGIKTANLEVKNDITLPNRGVYHTTTLVKGKTYRSISNIGFNPTFKGVNLSVETHIIDFYDDIYNEVIEVFFLKRKRDEIQFSSMGALAAQIRKDMQDRLQIPK